MDNQTVVVPNSILTNNSLTNVTARPERQLDLKVGIDYDADLKKAKELIQDMLNNDPAIMKDEEMKVFVDSLGDSAVIIGLRAWVKTEEYWATPGRQRRDHRAESLGEDRRVLGYTVAADGTDQTHLR